MTSYISRISRSRPPLKISLQWHLAIARETFLSRCDFYRKNFFQVHRVDRFCNAATHMPSIIPQSQFTWVYVSAFNGPVIATLRENLGSTEARRDLMSRKLMARPFRNRRALSHVPDIYGGGKSTQFERPWPRIYAQSFVNNYGRVHFVQTGICDGIQPVSKLRGYR